MFFEVLSPRDKTNPFAYSCRFILHTSYENDKLGQRGGGAVKLLKNYLL